MLSNSQGKSHTLSFDHNHSRTITSDYDPSNYCFILQPIFQPKSSPIRSPRSNDNIHIIYCRSTAILDLSQSSTPTTSSPGHYNILCCNGLSSFISTAMYCTVGIYFTLRESNPSLCKWIFQPNQIPAVGLGGTESIGDTKLRVPDHGSNWIPAYSPISGSMQSCSDAGHGMLLLRGNAMRCETKLMS